MERNEVRFEQNNNCLESYYQTPSGTYQLYYNYSMWSSYNPNFYGSVPAYQDLNRNPNEQNDAENIEIPSIDLTEESHEELEVIKVEEKLKVKTPSPTQAKDFKLFCEGCNRCFTSKKRLQNHVLKCSMKCSSAGKDDQKQFSCGECSKSFKRRSALLKHNIKCHEEILQEKSFVESKEIGVGGPRTSIFHSICLLSKSDA